VTQLIEVAVSVHARMLDQYCNRGGTSARSQRWQAGIINLKIHAQPQRLHTSLRIPYVHDKKNVAVASLCLWGWHTHLMVLPDVM